jgi:predicted phosphodiesterase
MPRPSVAALRRPQLRHVLPPLLGAVAALLLLGPLTRTTGTLGPGRVEVSASFRGSSGTVVEVPPLGRVSAPTHSTAVGVDVRLVELDVEALQQDLDDFDQVEQVRDEIEDQLPGLLRRALLGGVLRAAALGALVGLLLPARRWWHPVLGAAGAALVVVAALAGVARSFDATAFNEARYDGALSRAPAVFAAVQRHVDGLGDVQDRVATVSAQLEDLFATAAGSTAAGPDADVTILHVSDIHSNPLGVEVAGQLADAFDVEAILDTGDLTSFGLPVEARIAEQIADIGHPWYLVAGNHDSDEVRQALADAPNITVVDGEVDIAGLTVLGIPDPTFTAHNEIDTDESNARKEELAGAVAAITRSIDPDVLAVHDLRQAQEVDGDVPLVVAGHVHETTSAVGEQGTRFLTVGSTGATGLGSFTVQTDLPYEAELLRFDGGQLVAIDRIRVRGLDGAFEIEREVIEPPTDDAGG